MPTRVSPRRCFAGALGAAWILPFVAPMTWLLDRYLAGVPFSAISDLFGLLMRLAGVAIAATLLGLVVGAIFGFPVLVAMSALRINHPLSAGLVGGLAGVGLAYLATHLSFAPALADDWPRWGILLAFVGAGCGAMASSLSRQDPIH